MKSLKPRGAWLTYILQRQTKHLHIRGGVPPQQQGIKPSCRGRCGGRGILFSAKGDPQTNTIPSRNCLLLFQATSVHVHTIPRQSSSPGSTWIDGWVSNQSPHPEGYTQKRMWCSWPTSCVHLCELWTDIVTDVIGVTHCLRWLPMPLLHVPLTTARTGREGNVLWMLEQALAKFTVPSSLRLYLPTYNFASSFLSPSANANWITSPCQPVKHSSSSDGRIFVWIYIWIFLSHSKYKQFTKF